MDQACTIPIRNGSAQDVPAMLELERTAGGASHWTFGDYERIFDPGSPPRLALIAGGAPVVGFLVARTMGGAWEIENLAVAVASRRRGLGCALVGELLRRAAIAGAESIMLEVRKSNRPARALYETYGFQPIAERAGYYQSPPEDAVIYRATLSPGEQAQFQG